jgi:hypothetical protein
MPTVALCILLAGAVAGLFLAVRHFRRKAMPMPVALIHGLFGATALVILLVEVLAQPTFTRVGYAFAVLLTAAVLGFANFSFHLRKRRHRGLLIVLHALMAVTGASTLLFAIVG